jgi:hypothetical protein
MGTRALGEKKLLLLDPLPTAHRRFAYDSRLQDAHRAAQTRLQRSQDAVLVAPDALLPPIHCFLPCPHLSKPPSIPARGHGRELPPRCRPHEQDSHQPWRTAEMRTKWAERKVSNSAAAAIPRADVRFHGFCLCRLGAGSSCFLSAVALQDCVTAGLLAGWRSVCQRMRPARGSYQL